MSLLRFYPEVRSAHLERTEIVEAGLTLYLHRRSDFDETINNAARFKQRTLLRVILEIVSQRPRLLEVPEVLWFQYWPHTFFLLCAIRATQLLRPRALRTRVIAYAIENSDVERRPNKLRLVPAWLWTAIAKLATRISFRMYDRIAFGSSGARTALAGALGLRLTGRLDAISRTFEALPTRCHCEYRDKIPNQITFVGALENRKGFDLLVDAWPEVTQLNSDLSLVIAGDGPLACRARELAERFENVKYSGLIGRDSLHALLRESSFVVLPSQPHSRWREQVGLPIVEGLAHDCGIITTSETGLAPWLVDNHQTVIQAPSTPHQLAEAIVSSIEGADTNSPLRLPEIDARVAADRWLRAI